MQYGGGAMSDRRALLTTIFNGLAAGDGRAFQAALSEDIVWRVPGSSGWSGEYRGVADIRERLLVPLRARLGTIRSIADRIVVDGDHAAVEFHGDNQTVGGQRYDNRYVFMFRFAGDRIVEINEYMDTALAERVLGADGPADGQ